MKLKNYNIRVCDNRMNGYRFVILLSALTFCSSVAGRIHVRTVRQEATTGAKPPNPFEVTAAINNRLSKTQASNLVQSAKALDPVLLGKIGQKKVEPKDLSQLLTNEQYFALASAVAGQLGRPLTGPSVGSGSGPFIIIPAPGQGSTESLGSFKPDRGSLFSNGSTGASSNSGQGLVGPSGNTSSDQFPFGPAGRTSSGQLPISVNDTNGQSFPNSTRLLARSRILRDVSGMHISVHPTQVVSPDLMNNIPISDKLNKPNGRIRRQVSVPGVASSNFPPFNSGPAGFRSPLIAPPKPLSGRGLGDLCNPRLNRPCAKILAKSTGDGYRIQPVPPGGYLNLGPNHIYQIGDSFNPKLPTTTTTTTTTKRTTTPTTTSTTTTTTKKPTTTKRPKTTTSTTTKATTKATTTTAKTTTPKTTPTTTPLQLTTDPFGEDPFGFGGDDFDFGDGDDFF